MKEYFDFCSVLLTISANAMVFYIMWLLVNIA